jgi:citrate synthase
MKRWQDSFHYSIENHYINKGLRRDETMPARLRPWTSDITTVKKNSLTTHGINQTTIIKEFSFEDAVFLVLQGHRPSPEQRELLRAVLVSHISHGITGQSTLAVMQAADCRSSFINAAIAGFAVGSGQYHQGGLQAAMFELKRLSQIPPHKLKTFLHKQLSRGEKIIGFGHRFHSVDPRAQTLIEIATKNRKAGKYLSTAMRVEQILSKMKRIRMNIEAAGGGILLDMGFSPATAHLFVILGRSPMYAAVYLERLTKAPKPFPKIKVFDVVD